jgi:CheY-like chemotaxis protein
MDVNMPGATGPDTLEILQQINPSVRCCFMTGNIGAYHSEDLLRRGAVGVIDKPFDLAELARIIQSHQIAA